MKRAERRSRTQRIISRRQRLLRLLGIPAQADYRLNKWTLCRCGKRGMCSVGTDKPLVCDLRRMPIEEGTE